MGRGDFGQQGHGSWQAGQRTGLVEGSADLRIGDEVTRKVAELTDWLYLTDGQIVGGYTVKVLTMQQEESEK